MQFTQREKQVLKLIAHGYTPDEIGDFLGITRDTVRKITCNIKVKVKLQKATELAAYYWCSLFGTTLEEQRKSILSTIGCFFFLFTVSLDGHDKRRFRSIPRRKYEVELYTTI